MSFVNRHYLVGTDWLATHLNDPDLRIVDCTQYLPNYGEKVEVSAVSGRENYTNGHIPGAAYVDLPGELTDQTKQGAYAPMPSADRFAAVMSRIGIGEGTPAVLYDVFLGMWAARIWWMLRAFGFDDPVVLNGGLPKWKAEGRPVATEPATYRPARFVPRPRPELIASKEEVLTNVSSDRISGRRTA